MSDDDSTTGGVDVQAGDLGDTRVHLLVRRVGERPTVTACGRELGDCTYYVSSIRYVDCGDCRRSVVAEGATAPPTTATCTPE